MKIHVTKELRAICDEIQAENKTDDKWALIESDDMFQSESFEGGYEAGDRAFWFSYYAPDSSEWWFKLTLQDVHRICVGELTEVNAKSPD